MLLKQTLKYLPAQLIAPAAQLAAIIFWSHLLPPDKVAVITMLISIQDGAYILFFQWWSHYILRSGQASIIRKRYITESEPIALLICTVFLAVFVSIFSFFYLPHESFATPYLGISFVLTRALITYRAERARSAGHVRVYSLIQIGGSLGGLIASLITVKYWPYADTILLTFTTVNAILFSASISITKVKITSLYRWKILFKKSLQYGGAAALATACTFGVMNFQRFAAQGLWDFTTAGIFSVGYGIGSRIISVAAMMVSAAGFPLVIRRLNTEGPTGAIEQVSQNGLLLISILAPTLAISYYSTPTLVKILLPAEYQSMGIKILPLSALLATIRFLRSHSTDQLFLAFDKTRQLAYLGLTELVLSIASVIILYKLNFGIQALVLGPIIVCSITTIGSFLWAVLIYKMPSQLNNVFGILLSSMIMVTVYEFGKIGISTYRTIIISMLAVFAYGCLATILCPTLKNRIFKKS